MSVLCLRRAWTGALVRTLTCATGLLGALGVVGYLLSARLLFPDYWFAGMAIHTAAGLCCLAIGLWYAAGHIPSARGSLLRENDRITLVAALVLVATIFAAGIGTFAIMQERVQGLVRDDLQLALARRTETFEDLILLRESSALIAATRPAVMRNLRAIRAGRDDGSHIANVKAVIDSFVKQGFSAIAYRDADGRVVASGGAFAETPQMSATLKTAQRAELLWDDGFKLRHRIAMLDGEGKAGEMVGDQPLQVLTRLTHQAPGRGSTWDMGICVRRASDLQCFPQRLNPKVFSVPLANVEGVLLPMTRAVAGESGTIITKDYRTQNVVAAYGPVKDLGLGMVVKVDTAEVLQPVRDELIVGLGLLLVFVATGTLLLRFQVRPLATRLEQRVAERTVDLNRLNRVYAVLSGINALIVRVRERDELFREACRIAVQQGQFPMAWIGTAEEKIGRVKPVAWDGDVGNFFDTAPLADRAKKKGLASMAIEQRRPLISNDIQSDQHTSMKEECAARGIRSLVMLPLIVAGKGEGVLALYARELGFFDDEEMKLLLELASDISFALDHLQKAERINYLAYYDSLTGLPNRDLFRERLVQQVNLSASEKRSFALLKIDPDRFRTVNETLGRGVGDALLILIAERLARTRGERHAVGRVQGDRFATFYPGLKSEEEAALAARHLLEDVFGEPFQVESTELHVSAKIGVVMYPSDGDNADLLLANSEAAVKRAKETGDTYLFYEQQMSERVAARLLLENKLRQALEREEFVLHYQPKVNVETREVVGIEALIRWQNLEKGLVPPLQFIPLLEETGLILQVGAWALRRAALDHRGWVERKLKAPRVAVNVSAIQLRQRDFVSLVEQAIVEGIAPTAIDLEITESLVMEDIKGNIEKLKAVRDLGVNIAIDDFGTGYSSLGYLARLPAQALKIDRSFISAIGEDANAMTLVSTIISLAHSLHLKVIAEGVETEEQARFLRLLRCDQMQGYLFSKPLPADELVKLLQKS